jgi:hypothetical protein
VASPTPPRPVRVRGLPDRRRPRRRHGPLATLTAFLLAALPLAACGGGTTGPPATGAAASAPTTATQPAPAPVATTTTPAAAPPPAARTTATTHAAPSRGALRARGPGGAAAPADAGGSASASDLPASSAAETGAQPDPRSAPAATTPRREATPPQSAPPAPTGTPIDERAELTLTDRDSPAHYSQRGTVVGTYEGTMATEVRITSRGVIVDFTATVEGGTIVGRAVTVAVLDSTTMPGLRGTAAIFRGTGRLAGIHGRRLKVTGRSRPDGSQARVRLVGTVDF